MSKQNHSDSELWKLIVDNDSKAFAVLYERYWYKIYLIALRFLKNKELSEEIVLDIFFDIWNRRNVLNIHNMNAFLSVSAKYQVYTHSKAAKISPIQIVEDYEGIIPQTNKNMAEEKFLFTDFEFRLEVHLKNLPSRCQEIFKMSRIEQLSNTEIAQKFGISKRTVENQITIATKYLRRNFKDIAITSLLYFFLQH